MKLIIIGLNDSQGVDTSVKLNKRSYMYYFRKQLRKQKIEYDMFDCYSLLYNKTHYVEAFFKHNLDKNLIRLLQIHGNIMALRKSMIDYSLPKFISKIRNVYRITYPKAKENKRITTELVNSTNPFVIYSSGVNDLMKLIGTDPLSVVSQYKKKDKDPHYYYALDRSSNVEYVNTVIESIKQNLLLIKSYNSNTTVFVLGGYSPSSLDKDEMKKFKELVNLYNSKLQELCISLDCIYIDTNAIGKKYSKKRLDFHITTRGHKALSKVMFPLIIERLNNNNNIRTSDDYDNAGIDGIIEDINVMYEEHLKQKEDFRHKEIKQEFINELNVLNLVNNKIKKAN